MAVEGIGPEIAAAVCAWFESPSNRALLVKLEAAATAGHQQGVAVHAFEDEAGMVG